ncbi:hypothetical protein D7X98_04075 [bacterium 1XD8-76]|nr:hypothetical protein D7X98_04075 [bacterium 1XD8-76]
MSRVLPILFNTEMVRAILDGRKTVTRRLIIPHNRKRAREQGYFQRNGLWIDPSTDNGDAEGHIKDYSLSPLWMSYGWYIKNYAPYKPGDILYVRETWAFIPCIGCNGDYARESQPCYDFQAVEYDDGDSISDGCFLYRADCKTPERITWSPSIHMPKEAARIWLKVTNVRVERLQDIDTHGCQREGIDVTRNAVFKRFSTLWEATLKKKDLDIYGWKANPWVWVIEFERCEKPEDK